jgi:hypothetical protein
MEDERLTRERRKQFRELYAGNLQGPVSGSLEPLAKFLTRDHPGKGLNERFRALSQEAGGGVRVGVLTREEAARQTGFDPGAAGRFYVQARAFADFLVDRTGDPAIFAEFAQAAARGQGFEQWLAQNGARRGLASDMAGLQTLWARWLEARFGPPGVPIS